MDKPVCKDDCCTIEETKPCGGAKDDWPHQEPDGGKIPTCPVEETECCGPKNGNWPKPIEEDDNGLIPKPDGPGPENKPSCRGVIRGNTRPYKEPDEDKGPQIDRKPRPIEETECGGGEVRNWPDPDRNPDDRPIEETECGGGTTGNWPDEDKYPDDEEGWKKPTPGGPILDGKDPHEGKGPVGGPHIPIEEPGDGSRYPIEYLDGGGVSVIGPHPI